MVNNESSHPHDKGFSVSALLGAAISSKDISSSSKLIYWYLYAKTLGERIGHEFTMDQIAGAIGLGVRQARYCIRELEDHEWISVDRRCGYSSLYYIL